MPRFRRKMTTTDAEAWLLMVCTHACERAKSYRGGWLTEDGFDRVLVYLKQRYGQ